MKAFLTLVSVMLAGSIYASDPFPQTFENCADITETGWEASSTVPEKNFVWSVVDYSAETKQFPVNLQIPDVCGSKCLKGYTGGHGFNLTGAVAPDIRLVSPEFTVQSGQSNLRFLYANNMVTNGAANIAESDRAVFSVSVSPTADNAEDAFTEEAYSETPVNKNNWKVVNIDLSKYEGQSIRVQFRVKMANPVKLMTYNFLYIDNIELTAQSCPDIESKTLVGLVNGTMGEQYPTVSFVNHGAEAEGIELTLSAEGATPVSVTYPAPVGKDETVEYTFTSPIILPEGFEGDVYFNASHTDDPFTLNNTVSASTHIYAASELPFVLAEGLDAKTQMNSTASGTAKTPDGWQFITKGSDGSWVSTNNKKTAWLYPAQGFHLSGNPVKLSFGGNLVGEHAKMKVYLSKRSDDFGDAVAYADMSNGDVNHVILAPVAEEGNYLIALRVEDYAAVGNQFKLSTLKIEEAAGNPDLEILSVTPAGAIVSGADRSVSVSLRNQGAEAADNVQISYTCGASVVTETIDAVAAGQSIEHTFAVPLNITEQGVHTLSVKAVHNLDNLTDNNEMSNEITVYEPRQLPYRDSFEDETESALWTVPSDSKWFVSDIYEFDGTHMFSLSGKAAAEHNDWIYSPAIEIPQDFKGRLSFYYGSGGNPGTAYIDAYLTKTTDLNTLVEATPTVSKFAGYVDVDYSSTNIEGLEAGTYYIVFHARGGSQSMLLDDVRLDSNNEISIEGIELSSELKAAYEHAPATITVYGHNYGMGAINDLQLAYQATVSSFGEVTHSDIITASYDGVIEPGQEWRFTFPAPFEYDATGIYTFAAKLVSATDSDTKNNTFQVMGPEILPVRQLPALWDNERDDYLHGYTYNDYSGWQVAAKDQYAGQFALYHTGGLGNTQDGDWAFLNKVFIPAGTYQVSAFWRTFQNFDTEEYAKLFEIALCEDAVASDTHRVILANEAKTHTDKKSRKELSEFTVDKDGYYYLGVHLKESGAKGSIAIDDIKIEAPEAKYDLTNKGAKWESDFADALEDWYFYHPVKLYSQQWMPVTSVSGDLHAIQAVEFSANGTTYTTSYAQAPSLLMTGGHEYKVNVYAQISQAPYDDRIDYSDLSGNEAIVVYASDIDLPSEFKEIGRILPNENRKEFRYKPETDGVKYITFGTDNGKCAAFILIQAEVENLGDTGVDAIADEVMSGVEHWYTVDGVKTTVPVKGTHGIYIRVVNGKATKVAL